MPGRIATSRKLLGGLAPVLAIAVFAVVPTAAQATEPHWYENGVLNSSTPRMVVGFGKLSLAVTKPPALVGTTVTCGIAEISTVDNPVGGGAGVDVANEVITFGTTSGAGCESEKVCLAGTNVEVTPYATFAPPKPYFVNWPSVLEQSGALIRDAIPGVRLKIDCAKEGKVESSITFVGEAARSCHTGTSALHPGFLEWDAGSGELQEEGSGGTITAKIEGEVKILGYEEQELINCKNP